MGRRKEEDEEEEERERDRVGGLRLCLATARYLECQCNAVGRYVINASCRCYRCRGRYAKVVRVTTGNVRSCCAVMEYYYRSTSREPRSGVRAV